jgi:hypothetical protein
MIKKLKLMIILPFILGLFGCTASNVGDALIVNEYFGVSLFDKAFDLIPDDAEPACSTQDQNEYAKLDDYSLCREFYDGSTSQCLELELKFRFAGKNHLDYCDQVLQN